VAAKNGAEERASTFEKEKPHGDRPGDTYNRPDPGLQPFTGKLNGTKNQRQFRPSRRTIKKTKRKMPQPAALPAFSA